MFKFILAVLLICVLGSKAAQWSATGDKQALFFGISAPDEDHIYATGGGVYTSSDGGKSFQAMALPSQDLLSLAVSFNSSTTGVVAGLGLGHTSLAYTTDGQTWTAINDKKIQVDTVQDVDHTSFGFAATGCFGKVFGVSTSVDSINYIKSDWSYENRASLPRYGAFPSETTWYVAGGNWPQQPQNKAYVTKQGVYYSDDVQSISQNVHIVKKTGETIIESPLERNINMPRDDNNTFIGTIQKTTDGGKTWSNVYENEGTFYFNQIECVDENTCFVAAEGDAGAYIYTTYDGGKTWTAALTAQAGESIVSLQCLDSTTCWAAGAYIPSQVNIVGHFYLTTDGGKTWNLNQELKGLYIQDMSFISATSAWGTAINAAQTGELVRFN